MLSWPDFAEKQIVYIKSDELKNLKIKNGNLAVFVDGKIVNQISLFKIFAVFVDGSVTFTSVMIQKFIKNGTLLVLLNRNLSPYCVIGGEAEGNTLLRQNQYLVNKDFIKAKWIVKNKIKNQILLLRKIRKRTDKQINAIKFLNTNIKKIDDSDDFEGLLGLEGICSKFFFTSYFEKFNWHGRKPRTKFDEMNCLLDIGYTLLFNFIEAHLRLYGFDIYRGFYHKEFYQRKSLVCDLIEPFRCIIDYELYRCIALSKFNKKDFIVKNNEYCIKKGFSVKYVQLFLEAIMLKKEEIFKFLQSFYRVTIKDETNYPDFLIKK